jgi:hypothetical protein
MKFLRILIALAILVPLMTACNDDDDNPTASSTSDYRPVSAKAYIEADGLDSLEMFFRYEGEKLTQLVLTGSEPGFDEGIDTLFVDVNYNSDGKVESWSTDEYGTALSFEYDKSGMISRIVRQEDENTASDYSNSGSQISAVTRNFEDWDVEGNYYSITDKYTYETGKLVEIASQIDPEMLNELYYYDYKLQRYTYTYTGDNVTTAKSYRYNDESGSIDELVSDINLEFDTDNRLLQVEMIDVFDESTKYEFVYNDDYLLSGRWLDVYNESEELEVAFSYEWEKGKSNIDEVTYGFVLFAEYPMSFWSNSFNLFYMTFSLFD